MLTLRDKTLTLINKKVPAESTKVPYLGHNGAVDRHFFKVLRWNLFSIPDIFCREPQCRFSTSHLTKHGVTFLIIKKYTVRCEVYLA